jgi:hypothetical protein
MKLRRPMEGREMLRISHRIDNGSTDGGEVLSLTHRQRSTPQKHIFMHMLLISVTG